MVSATLAFLHVTTLEGPSIKEILHLELTGLLNSKAIGACAFSLARYQTVYRSSLSCACRDGVARLPLPRLLGGTSTSQQCAVVVAEQNHTR